MEVVFIAALIVVAWAHVGYPALTLLWAYVRPRPVRADASHRPSLTIVIAARDEARVIGAKIRSVLAEPWPEGRREVIVVDDGSVDGTAQIAASIPGVRVLRVGQPRGKAFALSGAAGLAYGEVLVLTDARQPLVPGSLAALCAPLADPRVGAVSGELELAGDAATGLGLYRRLDDAVRRAEAAVSSTMGVTGALWAVRRSLWTPLPEGLVLDDVAGPLAVARTGARVVIAPAARVIDRASPEPAREFGRRVRTLAGNLQLVRAWPWTLLERHPLRARFVSHKLSRLLAAPALVVLLVSSFGLAVAGTSSLARTLFLLQLLGYGLAAAAPRLATLRLRGAGLAVRAASLARSFVLVHVAALFAWWHFLRGGESRLWRGPAMEAAS